MLNFYTHLNEIRYRILYISFSGLITFLCVYTHIELILYLWSLPFLNNKKIVISLNQSDFIYTNIYEAFSSYLFLSLIITFYLTIPLVIKTWFSFVKPGLLKYEKQYVLFIINIFLLFGILSLFFSFNILLPMFLKFFTSFENLAKTHLFTIKLEPKIFDYINNTVTLILWCTFIFEIPIILIVFIKQTVFNLTILQKSRRFFLIGFIILGALLSPPDILAQLVIAIPFCIFFEICVFFSYLKRLYEFYLIYST